MYGYVKLYIWYEMKVFIYCYQFRIVDATNKRKIQNIFLYCFLSTSLAQGYPSIEKLDIIVEIYWNADIKDIVFV